MTRSTPALGSRIRALIRRHPTFGYRKLWALLRFSDGLLVNLKAVYRILKEANKGRPFGPGTQDE